MNFHIQYFFTTISAIKCQFCTKIRAPSRLVSVIWAKFKDVLTKILKREQTQFNKT